MKYSKYLFVLLLAPLFLAGCAGLSLEGSWVLENPSGTSHVVDIQDRSEKQYYFYNADLDISGIYKLKSKNILAIATPNNPRARGFEIQVIDKNHLRIIAEPSVRLTGVRYQGVELKRMEK